MSTLVGNAVSVARRRRVRPIGAFVFAGDSITGGQGISPTYPDLVGIPYGITVQNVGFTGHVLAQIAADITAATQTSSRALVIIMGGVNDIAAGETDSADILTGIAACVAAARARFPGCAVAVCTILPSTAITAGAKEDCRIAVNAALLGGSIPNALIVSTAAVSQLTDPTSLVYYGDGTHPTLLGREYLAFRVYEALRDSGIPGMPTPAPELSHARDVPGCLYEFRADTGRTGNPNVTGLADQTSNGHNLATDGRVVAPVYAADWGDGYPVLTMGGAANTGLVHEYSSFPAVTHITDTSAPFTRILYVSIPGASDGFTQCHAGAVFDSTNRAQVQNKTVFQAVIDEAGTHGGNAASTSIDEYGAWTVIEDGISGSSFRCRRDAKAAATTTLASLTFGASSPDRYALGCWVTAGGAASAKACSFRHAAGWARALTELEAWELRYLLRRTLYP